MILLVYQNLLVRVHMSQQRETDRLHQQRKEAQNEIKDEYKSWEMFGLWRNISRSFAFSYLLGNEAQFPRKTLLQHAD